MILDSLGEKLRVCPEGWVISRENGLRWTFGAQKPKEQSIPTGKKVTCPSNTGQCVSGGLQRGLRQSVKKTRGSWQVMAPTKELAFYTHPKGREDHMDVYGVKGSDH